MVQFVQSGLKPNIFCLLNVRAVLGFFKVTYESMTSIAEKQKKKEMRNAFKIN